MSSQKIWFSALDTAFPPLDTAPPRPPRSGIAAGPTTSAERRSGRETIIAVRREREGLLRNMMDVLLSLEGEYILSTRLGGQDASPEDKVEDGLEILNYQIQVSQIYL